MNIFFDLDGTLWDSFPRLYALFCRLSGVTIDANEFLLLKRNKITNSEILEKQFNFTRSRIIDFEKEWLREIESPEILKLDKIFDFTIPTLQKLSNRGLCIHYITLRQFRANVMAELEYNGILNYADKILVSEGTQNKSELIKKSGIPIDKRDIIVGDTGIDIIAGKENNLTTIGVLSGSRNKDVLCSYKPDFIIDNISNIMDYAV